MEGSPRGISCPHIWRGGGGEHRSSGAAQQPISSHKSTSSPCSPARAPCSASQSGRRALPTLLFSSRLSSDVCGGNEPLHSLNAKR